jgi:hypothetical protein
MQLHPLSYQATAGKPAITGRDLANKLRKTLPGERAVMALAIADGVMVVTDFTHAQAARLADVSVDSVSIVASATPYEIQALNRGWLSLRDVRALHAERCNKPTTANIEAFIDRVGPDAIMAALDRLTAPTQAAAE